MPDWPRDGFEGSLVHSSGFKGSSAAREAGVQRAVVVGSNTSAHDVAQSTPQASPAAVGAAASTPRPSETAVQIMDQQGIMQIPQGPQRHRCPLTVPDSWPR